MRIRKLAAPALAVLAGAALLTGGTWAFFSDTEDTPVQSVTAGTLDVEWVDTTLGNSAIGFPLSVENAQPGDTEPTRQLHLRNVGTLPAKVTLVIEKTADSEGANPESETNTTGDGDLDAVMTLSLDGFVNVGQTLAGLAVGESAIANGPAQSGADSSFTLAPGADKWIAVDWSIPTTAGNDIMGDSVAFKIHANAEQV